MQYKIGCCFWAVFGGEPNIWAITEIDKKKGDYIFTGISDEVKEDKWRENIKLFDIRVHKVLKPIEPNGEIVETKDRIYIQPSKEEQQDLGIIL